MIVRIPQKDLLIAIRVFRNLFNKESPVELLFEQCSEEISRLQKHIDEMSCCCAGCTKHNVDLSELVKEIERTQELIGEDRLTVKNERS